MHIDWKPDSTKLRQFGAAAALISTAIAGWTIWKSGAGSLFLSVSFLCLALLAGICAFFRPMYLKPVFIALSMVAFPIGWTINWIVLAITYYLVFTPFALVFRMIGRDALKRRSGPQDTYWLNGREQRAPASYYRQF